MSTYLIGVLTPVLRGDPGVHPNTTGLPGISTLQSIVGALLTVGIIACVGGLVVSAICWGVGGHQGNARLAEGGKRGILAAIAAGILVGGADALITFFSNVGTGL